jgi:XrtN system VIT domain protein
MIQLKKDPINLVGLGLISLSTFFFVFHQSIDVVQTEIFKDSNFLFHYILPIIFFIISGWHKLQQGTKISKHRLDRSIITLTLFWISCFSLNREIPIFHESTFVLTIVIACCSVFFIIPVYLKINNKILQTSFAIGSALTSLVLLYFSIYLLPGYLFGLLGFLLFGIGGHVFVPLAMLICQLKSLNKEYKNQLFKKSYFISGMLVLVCIGSYLYKYQQSSRKLDKLITEAKEQHQIPKWVYITQEIPDDYFSQLVLKKDLIVPKLFGSSSFDVPSKDLEGIKKHNPLLMIAGFITPSIKQNKLTDEETLCIILSNFEKHHRNEERLWRGDNLKTKKIITEVDLHPEYRLAYTEKTFFIQNTSPVYQRGRQDQEAIYQFHMPEGTVVTSLALWINGTEEKAILSTKKKAETAYKTIVGREKRDPSIITWKEGNIVSVKVFPCTSKQLRQVKIGFTSPLRINKNELIYEAISFEGPNPVDAKEQITIHCDYPIQSTLPNLMENQNYQGDYTQNWTITTANIPLNKTPFCFNNNCYSIKEIQLQKVKENIEECFLDLTKNWNEQEVRNIIKYGHFRYFCFIDNNKTEITANNLAKLLPKFQHRKFGLFPFHKIKKTNTTLLITKGGRYSVKMNNLKNSPFYNDLKEWQESHCIKVFLLGKTLTPYQKALHELRTIDLMTGDFNQLNLLLTNETFEYAVENQATVAIHSSKTSITKGASTLTSTVSSDHIMRIYAYNSILRDLPVNYNNTKKISSDLIDRAKEAYVVSPISSLIVLETNKDYERFDIKDTENSLKNAPIAEITHQLIFLFLIVCYLFYLINDQYLFFKKRTY